MTTLPVLRRKTTLPYTGRAKAQNFSRWAKDLPLTGKACERRLRRNQRTRLGAAVEKREEKCGAPDAFFGHRKRAF